jgi:polysaccharide transporter, PST family
MAFSAGMLAGLQLLGLVLPLLSLPVLARYLGVALFGQVMLAQFVVFFAVVFVDAGLNTESQRRAVVVSSSGARAQVLLDNILARAVLACMGVVAAMAIGVFMPSMPVWMVLVGLLQVLGTLAFPQWWFIARGKGVMMGLASTAGRLVSTLAIVFWVRGPDDVMLALAATCSATLISGVLTAAPIWREVRGSVANLDWGSWRTYLKAMRPTILPGFVASSSQSLPSILLGFLAGNVQVGLFTAADRLTRAAAYVGGVASQSLLNLATQWHQAGESAANDFKHNPEKIFKLTLWLSMLGVLVLVLISYWVIVLLYGEGFKDSVLVLQILAFWLGSVFLRSIRVVLSLSSKGRVIELSRLQWQEGLSILVACAAGAHWGGATGVAMAMLLVELGLWIRLHKIIRDLATVGASE